MPNLYEVELQDLKEQILLYPCFERCFRRSHSNRNPTPPAYRNCTRSGSFVLSRRCLKFSQFFQVTRFAIEITFPSLLFPRNCSVYSCNICTGSIAKRKRFFRHPLTSLTQTPPTSYETANRDRSSRHPTMPRVTRPGLSLSLCQPTPTLVAGVTMWFYTIICLLSSHFLPLLLRDTQPRRRETSDINAFIHGRN